MTVYKPISDLAGRAAEVAVGLALGSPPAPDGEFPNGSSRPIPFYREDPVAVFASNMDDTVIRDGFHSREDVYR
jgi:D-xylose transport system substrate-binding protein